MEKFFKPFALGLILAVSFGTVQSDDRADWSCDPGWVAFKDEKCFKIFDNTTRTYADAVSSCTSTNGATLPTIHSKDEQEFLSNYLFNTSKMVDNFWIGAHFVNNAFEWVDKSDFSYTNWDSRGPRSRANYCVQMQFDERKWYDDPCEKKYAVVCQKIQTWSMARLQQTLLDARKELRDAFVETNKKNDAAIMKMNEQKQKIDAENKEIIDKCQIPIGFIYTQLPNENPPTSIWPSMTWVEVSSAYAGVFFRVEGGGSGPFGQTQAENDWRLVRVDTTRDSGRSVTETKTIDDNAVGQNTKTSDMIWTGDWAHHRYDHVRIRLITTTGENRPRNMAIKIWKRTGQNEVSMTWSDISSTYAGVFFRVYGGDSNLFGETQSDNAPRLIKIEKTTSHNYYDHLIFDASSVGWSSTTSNWFYSGDWGAANNIFYCYTVSGCEVRPINMAIRVWKRID